ncbi:thiamine pyrophosphate-binding protein [Exilibacterium tricleocarpae]|uniref:Thiamine pyrophosphate-binding protein n=1 Tax=Exilibacterium tricleocarpae TaxID=2591008 RepID=A0A545U5B6_9GAMM|nr:thiamine pyrophosphate-binding protein [Exilibacterium tricleocarpae]TQV84661.1 thiamine pyrophosphate-binding protein [Exilibacterium tricleocarpae]
MLKPVKHPQTPTPQRRSVVTRLEPQATPAADESTYADMIVEYLERLHIDTVFGVPGGAIEPFLNALARSERRGGPRLVVARHECGAAFMADGYYRETGKLGVVCATTGPGATNLITGISSALADEVPILAITAQTPLPKFGKRALQESSCTAIDTVALFRHCTQFNTLISHHEQFESKLVSAIMAAHRLPRGPVHISIPSDILRTPAQIRPHIHSDLLVHDFSVSDETAIDRLCEKLGQVDTIAMYIGSGAGAASNQIMAFIELTGAAFATGPMGKTWVDETHPQYRGVYGFAGHDSAKRLFQDHEVDLVLAVGAALDELGTSGWNSDLLNTKLVHIDSSVEHFTRSPMANLHVFGNLDTIFSRLLENVATARRWGRTWRTSAGSGEANLLGNFVTLKEAEKCLSDAVPVKPQRLMSYLTFNLPTQARVFVDAGNAWSWATHYLTSPSNQGFYRLAMGYGSMAWAIGAAVGSAAGNPKAPTLCLVGDGSYLMGAQEITVAAQHKLAVVFMVLNDAALGMVMHGQNMGGQESIGWQLNRIDYAAMAEAMGIEGIVVNTPHELESLDIHRLFAKKGPTLIDVRIDRDEQPPMGDRIKGLAVNGSATPGG